MVKITGGVPGGWHGGQLPGASAPFRFQFDSNGEAEVESEIASYLVSVPGPFELVMEEGSQRELDVSDDADSDENTPEDTADAKPKPKRSNSRKKSLDE